MSLLSRVDDAFWVPFLADTQAWGADPRAIALIMTFESGFNPGAANKDSEGFLAIGLNQLIRSNWKSYFGDDSQETARQYLALPASEQWRRVTSKYFKSQLQNHPQAKSARDLYWLNFLPALYVPGAADDFIITSNDKIAASNPSLVLKEDRILDSKGKVIGGPIRAGGLTLALANVGQSGRWKEVSKVLDYFKAGGSPPPSPPSGISFPSLSSPKAWSIGAVLAVSALVPVAAWVAYKSAPTLFRGRHD